MTALRTQLVAIVRALTAAAMNSLRRRQGAGAVLIFPLLLAVLAIELARFGGRGAVGVHRVLTLTNHNPNKASWWVATWLTVLALALVALKLSRSLPGRGARRYFDTVFLRALPVSPLTRVVCELTAGHLRALGFVLVVWVPAVWGLAVFHHSVTVALAITIALAVGVNSLTTLVAMALDAGLSRRLDGPRLDLFRVASTVVGVTLVGVFTTAGPIGAGLTSRLRITGSTPSWASWVPAWGLVRWVRGHATTVEVFATLTVITVVLSVCSFVVLQALRRPVDVSLDSPWLTKTSGRWEPALHAWRVELRAMSRQAPWLFAGPIAFVAFFFVLAHGARSATHADLPFIVLMGLTGWAFVVLATALSGSAARRWRKVIWLPAVTGREHHRTVRSVAIAHTILTAPLALSVLATLLYRSPPDALFFLRMIPGLTVAIAVGHWALSASLFLVIDPSPDRLSGLSVTALFGVLTAALPTAVLLVTLSALPLLTWLALVCLVVLFSWSIERSASERLRSLRDPDGDPLARLRSWPALRAFGAATLAQLLAIQLAESPFAFSSGARLALGYTAFAAVMLPLGRRGYLRHCALAPVRWALPRSLTVGVITGVINFSLGLAYSRLAVRLWGKAPGPISMGLASAQGAFKPLLIACAVFLGPLSEELLFRGWLQPALGVDLSKRYVRFAPVISAAVFATLHLGAAWPMAFTSGLISGWLMARSQRIEASAVMHIVSNSLVVALALSAAQH